MTAGRVWRSSWPCDEERDVGLRQRWDEREMKLKVGTISISGGVRWARPKLGGTAC